MLHVPSTFHSATDSTCTNRRTNVAVAQSADELLPMKFSTPMESVSPQHRTASLAICPSRLPRMIRKRDRTPSGDGRVRSPGGTSCTIGHSCYRQADSTGARFVAATQNRNPIRRERRLTYLGVWRGDFLQRKSLRASGGTIHTISGSALKIGYELGIRQSISGSGGERTQESPMDRAHMNHRALLYRTCF